MSKKCKIISVILLTAVYILSLMPFDWDLLWFVSTFIYAAIMVIIYRLKILKSTTMLLLAEMILTAAVALVLFQLNHYFSNAFYLMIIFVGLFVWLLFEVEESSKDRKKIILFTIIGIVLFLILRTAFIQASLRIRKENQTQLQKQALTTNTKHNILEMFIHKRCFI